MTEDGNVQDGLKFRAAAQFDNDAHGELVEPERRPRATRFKRVRSSDEDTIDKVRFYH